MHTPLTFSPLLKTRVWGGELLKTRSKTPPAEPVGESWEIADHGDDSVAVAQGPYERMTLHQLFENDTRALCGDAIDSANPAVFPLMLKLIDPARDLSVQVHPDDADAGKRIAGELGKTEAWYILDAERNGKIYHGLAPGVTREQFAEALEAGTVAELLRAVEVTAGDVVHIPAGTVHALGAGVRIAEIQQNSDTTYRVFDWNRVGLDGKPRALHIEDALAVTNFDDDLPALRKPEALPHEGCTRERYIDCDKFRFEKLSGFEGEAVEMDTDEVSFHILTVVRGRVEIATSAGSIARGRWDTALLPACTGAYTLLGSNDAEVLLFYRPPSA